MLSKSRKSLFIQLKQEALRCSVLIPILSMALAVQSVAGLQQQLDISDQIIQQNEQDSYNDNMDQALGQNFVQQQQLMINGNGNGNDVFGSRPSGLGRQAGRPDFSSFGLRPTTSTTTEQTAAQQQEQQQQVEDLEQPAGGRLPSNAGAEAPIVQQNNLSGNEDDNQTGGQQQQVLQPASRPTSSTSSQTSGQQTSSRPTGARPVTGGQRPRPAVATTELPAVQQNEDDSATNNNSGANSSEEEAQNNNEGQQQVQEQVQQNENDDTNQQTSAGLSQGSQGSVRPTGSSQTGSSQTGLNGSLNSGRPASGSAVTNPSAEELQQIVNGGDQQVEDNQELGNSGDSSSGTGNESDDQQQQQVVEVQSTTTRRPFVRPTTTTTRRPTTTTTTTTTTTSAPISQQNNQDLDSQFEQNNGADANQDNNQDGQQTSDENDTPVVSSTTTTQAPVAATSARTPVSGQTKSGLRAGLLQPGKGRPAPLSVGQQQQVQRQQSASLQQSRPTVSANKGPARQVAQQQLPQPSASKGRRPQTSSGLVAPVNQVQQQNEQSSQQQQQEEAQQVTGNGNTNSGLFGQQGGRPNGNEAPIVQQNNLSGTEEDDSALTQGQLSSGRPTGGLTSQNLGGSLNQGQQTQRPNVGRPTNGRPRPVVATTELPAVQQNDDEASNGSSDNNGDNESTQNQGDSQQLVQQNEEFGQQELSSGRPQPVVPSRPNNLAGQSGSSANGANSGFIGERPRPTGPATSQVGNQNEEIQQIVNGGDQQVEDNQEQSNQDSEDNSQGSNSGSSNESDDQQQQQVVEVQSTTTRRPFVRPTTTTTRRPTTTTTTTTTTTSAPISQQNNQDLDSQFEQNNGADANQDNNQDGQQTSDENDTPVVSSTTTTQAPVAATSARTPVSGQTKSGLRAGLLQPGKGRPAPLSVGQQQQVQRQQSASLQQSRPTVSANKGPARQVAQQQAVFVPQTKSSRRPQASFGGPSSGPSSVVSQETAGQVADGFSRPNAPAQVPQFVAQSELQRQQPAVGVPQQPSFKARAPQPVVVSSQQINLSPTKTSAARPQTSSASSSGLGANGSPASQSVASAGNGSPRANQLSSGATKQGPRQLGWMGSVLSNSQPASSTKTSSSAGQTEAVGSNAALQQPRAQAKGTSSSGSDSSARLPAVSGPRAGLKSTQQASALGGAIGANQAALQNSNNRASATKQAARPQLSAQRLSPAKGQSAVSSTGESSGLSQGPLRAETKSSRPVSTQTGGLSSQTVESGSLLNEGLPAAGLRQQLTSSARPSQAKGQSQSARPTTQLISNVQQQQQFVSPATSARATKSGPRAQSNSQLVQDLATGNGLNNLSGNDVASNEGPANGLQVTTTNTNQLAGTKGGRAKVNPSGQFRMSPGAKSRLATKSLQQQLLAN